MELALKNADIADSPQDELLLLDSNNVLVPTEGDIIQPQYEIEPEFYQLTNYVQPSNPLQDITGK